LHNRFDRELNCHSVLIQLQYMHVGARLSGDVIDPWPVGHIAYPSLPKFAS